MTPIGKLQELLGIPELMAFSDNPSSWFTDRDAIKEIISKKIETGTIAELLAVLEPADIWCAKVLNWEELMEHDGFKVLDMLQRVEREDNVSILTTCSPLRVNGIRPHHHRAAPRVGEHSDRIRAEFAL
jgi:CoA:oxalate CoA-transferase